MPQHIDTCGHVQEAEVSQLKCRLMAYGYEGIQDHGPMFENMKWDRQMNPRHPFTPKNMAGIVWTSTPTEEEKALHIAGAFDKGWKGKKSELYRKSVGHIVGMPPSTSVIHTLHFKVGHIHTAILRTCYMCYQIGSSVLYGENEFVFRSNASASRFTKKPSPTEVLSRVKQNVLPRAFRTYSSIQSDPLAWFMSMIRQQNVSQIRRVVLVGPISYYLPMGDSRNRNLSNIFDNTYRLNMLHVQSITLREFCPNLQKLTLHREGFARHMTQREIDQTEELVRMVVKNIPVLKELKLGYFDDWFKSNKDRIDWGPCLKWELVVKHREKENVLTPLWLENLRKQGKIFKNLAETSPADPTPKISSHKAGISAKNKRKARGRYNESCAKRQRVCADSTPRLAAFISKKGYWIWGAKRKAEETLEGQYVKRYGYTLTTRIIACGRANVYTFGRYFPYQSFFVLREKALSRAEDRKRLDFRIEKLRSRASKATKLRGDNSVVRMVKFQSETPSVEKKSGDRDGSQEPVDTVVKTKVSENGSQGTTLPEEKPQEDPTAQKLLQDLGDIDNQDQESSTTIDDGNSAESAKETLIADHPTEPVEKKTRTKMSKSQLEFLSIEAQLVNLPRWQQASLTKKMRFQFRELSKVRDNIAGNAMQNADVALVNDGEPTQGALWSTHPADTTVQNLLDSFEPEPKRARIETQVVVADVDTVATDNVAKPLPGFADEEPDQKRCSFETQVAMPKVNTTGGTLHTTLTPARIGEILTALLADTVILITVYVLLIVSVFLVNMKQGTPYEHLEEFSTYLVYVDVRAAYADLMVIRVMAWSCLMIFGCCIFGAWLDQDSKN